LRENIYIYQYGDYVQFRASYAVPLALCCVLTIFFLIAATIVLALIPVYLSTRNVELGDTSRKPMFGNIIFKIFFLLFVATETLSAGFASDQVGARSDSIGNTNSASRQASLALSSDTNSLSSQVSLTLFYSSPLFTNPIIVVQHYNRNT
jgi:hypothetical protein